MKVAIDVGTKSSGHEIRGIGVHTRELLSAIEKLKTDVTVDGIDFKTANLSKYDLLHYPYFSSFFLSLPSKKPAKKMLVTIHDLIPLIYPEHYPAGIKGKLKFIEQKRRLKKVDGILTISETSKKDICRLLSVNPDLVHVVYLAQRDIFKPVTDKKLLQTVKAKYKLPDKFVLYVGDVNYNKNIPTLVTASKKAGIPLVMVGKSALSIEDLISSGHPEHAHLSEIEKDLSSILRLGFVPDEELVAIYSLATLYCQASYYEGFGLPLLEAMACGTPVVASRIQVHVEIAEGAALFAVSTPDSMASAFKEILSNKSVREGLIEQGFKKIKNYSWESTAKETIEVYQTLLK